MIITIIKNLKIPPSNSLSDRLEGIDHDPNALENRIIYAMALSTRHDPKANDEWRKIVRETRAQQRQVGHSRNKIFEIATAGPQFQDTIVIKKGLTLKKEYELLGEIYFREEDMAQFFPRPLAFYKENEEEVLVLKRKLARPLLQTITPQNAQAIAEEFIELISKIHSSKLLHRKLKTIYDPIAEIERRFLNRFPGNGDNFKKAYEILLQKLRITKIVPSHCDAYPTNFLRNGNIILDLETMCFAPPSFDIETFLSVPEFQDIDKNQAKASYGRILPPEDECRFYELHNAFCQIGSFYSQGNPPLVEYFYNKAKTLLSGMRESILLSCLDRQIRDFL